MKNLRTFLFFGILVTLAAALGLSTRQAAPESTLPSVDNPGPLGLRALYLYLQEGGATVEVHRDSLETLPASTRTVVIPAPQGRSISSSEVEALERFVRAGGTLVFLASQDKDKGQPALEQWLELGRPKADSLVRGRARELLATAPAPADRDEIVAKGEALIARMA